MRAWASGEAPRADVDRETAKLRNHEFSKPRSDWMATWQNWMLTADERAPTARSGGAGETDFQRSQRERVEQMTGGLVSARPPGAPRQTFLEEVTDVTPRKLG